MNKVQHVFYGMAGQLKAKIKSPLMVYENVDNAKEFANNYTDLSKEPKVIQFELENPRVIDLTLPEGKEIFEQVVKAEGLVTSNVIDYKKEYFDDKPSQIENLDTLMLKKVQKALSDKFDVIKGVSVLDDIQVSAFCVLNTEVLKNTQTLEIDLEGDLWEVEFKK